MAVGVFWIGKELVWQRNFFSLEVLRVDLKMGFKRLFLFVWGGIQELRSDGAP
jgi:hypothetical protein